MHRRSTQIVAHTWLVLLVLAYLVPIWLMIVTSFRSPNGGGVFRDWSPFSIKAFIPYEPDFAGYLTLFGPGSAFPQALLNTLVVCAITLVVGTAINMLAGFTFAYFDFRGGGLIFAVTLVTFMVPFEAIVIPILSIMQKLSLVDTLAAVILPTIANGFLVFLFRQFYRGIPRDLREASMIDGASLWVILRRIYLPLSRPIIVTSAIVLFIAQWQALFLPLAVLRSPSNWVLQLALSSLQGTIQLPSWGPVLAAAVITLVIPVVLVSPFMGYFKLALLDGATRG